MPSVSGTMDLCNLGSLSGSVDPKKLLESKDLWRHNSDDDMCQIDGDDFTTTASEVKFSPVLIADNFNKVSSYFRVFDISELSRLCYFYHWICALRM